MPAPVESPLSAASFGRELSTALLDGWKTLRKRWLWAVTLLTLTLLLVGLFTARQPRVFRSTAVIQIDPKPPKPLGQDVQAVVDVGTGSFWSNTEYYRTQFKIMQSRSVAEETVRRLGLHHDTGFLLGLPPSAQPSPAQVARAVSVEDAAARLRANLIVEPIKESRLVKISYEDPNPERARRILSGMVSAYVDRNIDVALDSTTTAAEWLRSQLDNLKTELVDSEMALHEYKADHRILSVTLDDQSNMLRQQIQQLSAALTAVRVRQAQVAAKAQQLAQVVVQENGAGLSSPQLLRDPTLQGLRATLGRAVAERDGLVGAGKGRRHPLVASANARVGAARAALMREVENVKLAAGRELSMVEQEVESLAALYEQAQARALQLGRLEIEYRRLERTKTNTEKLYSLVMERSKESDLTRMMRFNNIQVIDPPLVPKSPIRPRAALNMGLGLFAGVALGLFGAFARELFDRSVKSPSDIEQELGLTFLGLLPRVAPAPSKEPPVRRRGRKRGVGPRATELIVHDEPSSAIAEAARGVRTNLSFMSPDSPHSSFLVTSATPAEGKTTVACCLAIAMAQAGHQVLLVDCDLRRPRLHKIFGHPNEQGVTTVLMGQTPLESAVKASPVPKMSLLLSGPMAPNPAENLQSQRFSELLASAGERYDRIVIDSPPVGSVTDATILSTRIDATVLVIRATATTRDNVSRAARILRDVRANLVGAVLNATDRTSDEYYYHYNRYYGTPSRESVVDS